jgi:hypothetical protein
MEAWITAMLKNFATWYPTTSLGIGVMVQRQVFTTGKSMPALTDSFNRVAGLEMRCLVSFQRTGVLSCQAGHLFPIVVVDTTNRVVAISFYALPRLTGESSPLVIPHVI